MTLKRKLFIWLSGIALLGASCTSPQDIQVERETVDLAFPIFTSETTLSDLIESSRDSSALVVFSDNSMGLVYNTNTTISVPMPNLEDSEIILPSKTTVIPNSAVDGVLIAHAKFNGGKIALSFENANVSENISVVVSFPEFKQNGIPLQASFGIPYNGSLPTHTNWEADLKGYSLDLSHGSFKIEYSAKLADGTETHITNPRMSLKEVDFDYVDGDWSKRSIPFSIPSNSIGFFDHYNGTNVAFTNPSILVTTQNPIGVPSMFNINNISVHTNTNQTVPMNGELIDYGLNIEHPTMIQVGDSKTSIASINKENSNIVALAAAQPNKINYDMEYVIAPNGTTEGFITKDSKVDLAIQARLPFEGTVMDFKVEKDFDIKFTNEYIQSASIKLQAENQIPLDARIQLYFIDNADIILDSLVSSNGVLIIDAAKVDFNGEVNETTTWEEDIPVSQEKWERIKKAIKIKLVTAFTTTESGKPPVKIKANQQVLLNAGMKATVLP